MCLIAFGMSGNFALIVVYSIDQPLSPLHCPEVWLRSVLVNTFPLSTVWIIMSRGSSWRRSTLVFTAGIEVIIC